MKLTLISGNKTMKKINAPKHRNLPKNWTIGRIETESDNNITWFFGLNTKNGASTKMFSTYDEAAAEVEKLARF